MYPRQAEARIRKALRDTPIVTISGPRQSGKTTLAKRFQRPAWRYLSLDDATLRDAARRDPVAFVAALDRAIIDEVQRAPDLLLAIKRAVDEDRRAGRFILTGSANLLTIPTVRESLAGRVETIPLYPLARSEILRAKRTTFLSKIFRGDMPQPVEKLTNDGLLRIVLTGGYPEALARKSERRRSDWHRAYLQTLMERDVPEIAAIDKSGLLPKLLEVIARLAGQLLNLSEVGRHAALSHKTVDHYLRILEQLFLVRRVLPWHRNALSRLLKTPKVHFIDSGLLAVACRQSYVRLQADRNAFGPILESFVLSELLKAATWWDDSLAIWYYRDKDQLEVDFVLENGAGEIVGVEVKAAASVSSSDFRGLARLAAVSGEAFKQGVVLYCGDEIVSFAPTLRAVPIACLWS